MFKMRANWVLLVFQCTSVTAGGLTREQVFARVRVSDTLRAMGLKLCSPKIDCPSPEAAIHTSQHTRAPCSAHWHSSDCVCKS